MKKIYLLATALAALVSCTSEDFTGDQNLREANGSGPISFGFDVPAVTRAGGSAAATALGNQFIIYGEKGDITNVAPTTGNLVFPNYLVKYTTSTAYTTTSNTKDWEYVGITHPSEYPANITRKASSSDAVVNASSDVQTIKYWDYGAANYIFTAVSADDADIKAGRVKIQKNEYGTTAFDKGYTITLTKTPASGGDPAVYPTLNKLYFSDREVIEKSAGSDRKAKDAYGGYVELTFRNLVSQIRAGVYETIPGYDISEIKFYISDGADDGTAPDLTTDHAFGAICKNTKVSEYEGTLTVVYYQDGDVVNQPKITASGDQASDLILGDNFKNLTKATDKVLGKTASAPTWDNVVSSVSKFTEVLPQINNNDQLKLMVDYTLWNSVSDETIEVKGATAVIPAQYLRWKPNYKYTYLFKISDNTNGQTGTTGPTGLYPITFDAVQVVAEDGNVEYITTVSEPSITTYAKASAVTSNCDYKDNETIYAVVEQDNGSGVSTLQTLSASNMNLYKVTTTDATNFPITAASVAEALIEAPTLTTAQAANAKISCTEDAFTYGKTVIDSDGTTLEMDATNNVVASFVGAKTGESDPTYYALVYQKTAATYTTDGGKNDYTSETYAAAGTLYTDSDCTTKATSFVASTTYYKRTAVATKGEYTIKIVKVVP